jgi:hypothetical protein
VYRNRLKEKRFTKTKNSTLKKSYITQGMVMVFQLLSLIKTKVSPVLTAETQTKSLFGDSCNINITALTDVLGSLSSSN